jgi:heat shock protein HslJ
MKILLILGTICSIILGCIDLNENQTKDNELMGTSWNLVAWSISSIDLAAYTITIDFSESEISGHSAVNSYGGNYTTTPSGHFMVSDVYSTLMGGSAAAMSAESMYFELLAQVRNYELIETTLTLQNANNQPLLIFHTR